MSSDAINKKLKDLETRIEALERLRGRELTALDSTLSTTEIAELSPRTQALRITSGIDQPHPIGRMSPEAIKTELRALEGIHDYVFQDSHGRGIQKINDEKQKWRTRYDALRAELAAR